jgi:putative hydrolase of HD superfamily
MIARALAPLADEAIDVERVVQILLVHDIVEADAGDTYIYDAEAAKQKEALETAAAERIFGLLPGDEGRELHELWLEYERRDTPDGRFAYACDRLQPFLLNAATGGRSWEAHGVHVDQVREIMAPVGEVAPRLGDLVHRIIDEAVAGGHLAVGAR